MNERTIVIAPETQIGGDVVSSFLEQFYELDSEDGPITVVIASDGGWSNGGMAIFDAIKYARNHVTTLGLGSVGSIAVLILQAGHTRLMGPNCVLYLHETSLLGEGSVSQMEKQVIETRRMHTQYCELISKRSGAAIETIELLCKEEGFVVPGAALKLGLIDGILGTETEAELAPKKKKATKAKR